MDGRYADDKVETLAISTGDPDWYLKEFKTQLGATMPWLRMDTRLPNPYYQEQYDLWGLGDTHPTLVMLDANGIIRYRATGNGGVGPDEINYRYAFDLIGELIQEAQGGRTETAAAIDHGFVGQGAPDFTLDDMAGNPVSLSDYRGKVVVMDFWSWGCAVCGDPDNVDLKAIYRESDPERVAVLSVNLYPEPEMEQMDYYIEIQRIFYPVLLRGFDVGGLYDIGDTPTLLIVDAEGTVRYRAETEMFNEDAQGVLDELLAE